MPTPAKKDRSISVEQEAIGYRKNNSQYGRESKSIVNTEDRKLLQFHKSKIRIRKNFRGHDFLQNELGPVENE